MSLIPACRADARATAERAPAERIAANVRAVRKRQGGTVLDEDELRRSKAMTERIDRLIHSPSEKQRERGFRLMDRPDAPISTAWHRAAAHG